MKSLRETTAKPSYILGNFPRVEIVFGCVGKLDALTISVGSDAKIRKLVELKKLLDAGVLTQQEFDSEKLKILSEP